MAWYWWVLIVVGLVAFAFIKTKASKAFLSRRKKAEPPDED